MEQIPNSYKEVEILNSGSSPNIFATHTHIYIEEEDNYIVWILK